jgi:glycosyltransferase involved in cell wall biosynthesis
MSSRDVPLTVLMGVYNNASGLERSISGILQQTYGDFEFLIVNDASTDCSAEILERYAQNDQRIKIINNASNLGLGAALSVGVDEARGALIARMDADDFSVQNRLEKQIRYFRENPDTDILGSFALDVTATGEPIGIRRVPIDHQDIVRLIWSCPFIHPTVMFKTQSIKRAGNYSKSTRRRQDYELWFRCVYAGLRLANLPEPLVQYHFSETTLKRNTVGRAFDQVKIGLKGCRLVDAPWFAYFGTCVPLIETCLPDRLRLRSRRFKALIDPRRRRLP